MREDRVVNMSVGPGLRALVQERLTAAAEEIFGLFERTMVELEEELRRSKAENQKKQALLEALNPRTVLLFRADLLPSSSGSGPNQGLNRGLKPDLNQGLSQVLTPGLSSGLNVDLNPGVNPEVGQTLQIKTEPEEQRIKHEEEEEEEEQLHLSPPVSSPEKTIEVRADGGHTDSDTDSADDWRAPFSCSEMDNDVEEPGTSGNTVKETPESSGKKLHKCPICEKTLTSKQNLKIHTRVHTGEKPYSCSVCGKAFVITSKLKVHMRTHTGEKPYSCSFCHKTFSQKGHLDGHVRIHTGDRPFGCPLCGKTFTQRPHLKGHMIMHRKRGHGGQTDAEQEQRRRLHMFNLNQD